jgi:hypothetical protein
MRDSSVLFGGEDFLQGDILPDYEKIRSSLTIKLGSAALFFLILVPLLALGISMNDQEADTQQATKKKKAQAIESNNKKPATKAKKGERSEKTSIASFSLGGFFFVAGYLLLSGSPNNRLTARSVFQSPLFTRKECRHILDLADQAAAHNYEAALAITPEEANATITAWKKEPLGWGKMRHGNYPTTDLNMVIDPFTKQDREWLGDLLDRRLAPTLARVFGIPPNSIRANDMFVVRYDAGQRIKLDKHTDDSDISVNILLNEDFTDGGTIFWNRVEEQPYAHVQPTQPGTLLSHSARIRHEGAAISSGTRFILVGFLSVDRIDPFTHSPTGMSQYASWFSLPWMTVRFKAGYLASRLLNDDEENLVARFFKRVWGLLDALGDLFANHHHSVLVADTDAEKYLDALDEAYGKQGETQPKASWFRGQQISLNFDGSILNEWAQRTEHSHIFEEL